MADPRIRVGVDVGSASHHVGIACPEGNILEEFDISHDQEGFGDFFDRVERHQESLDLPVSVAMEGYNGHVRPLDQMVLDREYPLYNVNNLKLARFREMFPGAAKNDPLDTRNILKMSYLNDQLLIARGVLQLVPNVPEENKKLKRLSRRRRHLVDEKVRVENRLKSDLSAVCPELSSITCSVDNLWFLRFISSRKDLMKLAGMRQDSLLSIPGVGKRYAGAIQEWQKQAKFSAEVTYVGPMIIADAKRLLEIREQVADLDKAMEPIAEKSDLARLTGSIPGFGKTTSTVLAGEIGTMDRFDSEASLALYLGMCPLDNKSGKFKGTKAPRHVNRRCKAAMMTAVAQHVRFVPQSKAYYDKKRGEGKKHNQAIRCLGRHLVRVIWSMIEQGREYELR